jgi:hypothetical protein
MKLTMLFKDQGSGGGGCPSIYLDEAGDFVVQGHVLDGDTEANLANVLPGEAAVRISRDIMLGALEAYRARG